MKDELSIKDFWIFLKNNSKVIFFSTIAVTLLALGYVAIVFLNSELSDTGVENEQVDEIDTASLEEYKLLEEVPFDLMTESEVVFMQNYLKDRAYRFMFFLTNENGEPFGNLNMMRAIFRHPDVVSQAEEIIGEELVPDPTLSVNILSYADSGLFELNLGRETDELSEELAHAYYQLLENDEIAVLSDFNVTLFEDVPIPLSQLEEVEEVEESVTVERSRSLLIRNVILFSIIGVFGGLLIGLGISFFKMLTSKNISALFTYENDFTDKIVRLNHLSNANEIVEKANQNIIYPKNQSKLILVDENQQERTLKILDDLIKEENITVLNDISQLNTTKIIDEVIILSELNNSRKDWYNNQRVQLNGYSIPIKIIQL